VEQEPGFTKLQSGELGGGWQMGAKITDGEIKFMIFFSDLLEPQGS
jgi:methylglyoxal synthase